MEKPRRILHVDCDMYFVQVAKLEDPEGVGRQRMVVVGGRPEGRGVVTSASYEVREFGVRSGMPMSQALRLCPQAVVVPVPREACSRRSREVGAVLARFTPVVEAASIDEFYLDLTGTERLYGGESLEETARTIQRAVREEAGIAVSIGGGSQRMISKMATRLAKPDGVYTVPAGEEAAFMLRFEVSRIPGVGPVLAETLRRRGVTTVRDALAHDRASLCLWLGDSRGSWLFDRVRGVDPTPVEPRGEAKSVSHERTFSVDVRSAPELETQLLRLVGELGSDLRRKGLRARTLRVYVRDHDFKDRQIGRTTPQPVDSDRALYRLGREMLRELWARRPVAVRLLGIGASNFTTGDPEQMLLLEPAAPLETERDRRVARAADSLRARFGREAIRPARVVPGPGPGPQLESD